MLFRISKDLDFFETNPEAELLEEFSSLKSSEMKYIALVYDYDSMLRNIPLQERKVKALDILKYERNSKGGWNKSVSDMMTGKDPKFLIAASKYRDLMSDTDKDSLVSYQALLKESQDFLLKSKKASEIKEAMMISKQMENLRDIINDLKDKIEMRDEKNEYSLEEGGMASSLSLMEEVNNLEYDGESE